MNRAGMTGVRAVVKSFAALLDRLVYTPSRNGKLRLLADYFRRTPDPDRGWALAALTGNLDFPNAKAGAIRDLAREQTDEVLFALSYDYVGDLAETTALLWQTQTDAEPPRLADVVEALQLRRQDGGARPGLRLARRARRNRALGAAQADHRRPAHRRVGAARPGGAGPVVRYGGRGDRGSVARCRTALCRPVRLARRRARTGRTSPAARSSGPSCSPIRWKKGPISIPRTGSSNGSGTVSGCSLPRAAAIGGSIRAPGTISRPLSPTCWRRWQFDGVLDGELLVRDAADPGSADPASFNALQQRLNRKTVSKKMLAAHPAYVIAYDILFDGASDLRGLSLEERRPRLETFVARHDHPDIELSEPCSRPRTGLASPPSRPRRAGWAARA